MFHPQSQRANRAKGSHFVYYPKVLKLADKDENRSSIWSGSD